jgi:hypothetical protein
MAVTFLGLTFGDDGTGWVWPTANQLRAAMAAYIASLRGKPNLQTNPGSLFGDFIDLVVTGVDIAGQGASEAVDRTVFTAMEDVALDQFLADYLRRVVATPSTAVVYAYGAAGTAVPAFTPVRTSPVGVAFITTNGINLVSPSAAYVVDVADFAVGAYAGQLFRVTVDGNDADYVANNFDTGRTVRDGLVAAVDALLLSQTAYFAGQSPTTSRQSLLVREDGGGGAFALSVTGPALQIFAFPAGFSAVTTAPITGPTTAPAGSLRYGTIFAGQQGYVNPEDAAPGLTGETDSQFRARHQIAQRGLGGGSPDAIRAIEMQPVAVGGGGATLVSVEYNPGDDVDAAGNVGHSVRVVVASTDSGQSAADALWIAKAAGDNTNGTELYLVRDFVGDLHPMLIDRLTDLWIAAVITISVGPDWPNMGDPLSQVRQDVVDFIEALQASKGLAVRVGDLPIAVFPNGLPRGVDAWTVTLGSSTAQGGPYTYLDTFPTVEPDAELASVPVGLRQKPRAQFVDVTASIV